MTLETLQGVLKQLEVQYTQLLSAAPKDGKPALQHTNALELLGAMQLARQLIIQEEQVRAAPPGSTGPIL